MELVGVGFFALFFLGFLGLAMGLVALTIAQRRRASAAWERFARERHLSFVPGGAFGHDAIHGNLDGLPFTINTITIGSGKNSQTYTQWHVELPAWMPSGMALRREVFMSGLDKLFGAQDIEIGDPQIDGALMIEGSDPHGIRNLVLDPQVRPLLLNLASSFQQFCIGSRVLVQTSGRESDPQVLERSLRQAVQVSFALAQAVQRQGSSPINAPSPVSHLAAAATREPAPVPLAAPAPGKPDPAYAGVSVQEHVGYGAEGGSPFRSNARPADLLPLPAALAPLARRELPTVDQQRVVEEAKGCWHVLEVHVQRVESTHASHVPQAWAGGCTLIGVAAAGLDVAVSFPRTHAAHVGGVKPGMSIRMQAGVISWDAHTRLLRLGAV